MPLRSSMSRTSSSKQSGLRPFAYRRSPLTSQTHRFLRSNAIHSRPTASIYSNPASIYIVQPVSTTSAARGYAGAWRSRILMQSSANRSIIFSRLNTYDSNKNGTNSNSNCKPSSSLLPNKMNGIGSNKCYTSSSYLLSSNNRYRSSLRALGKTHNTNTAILRHLPRYFSSNNPFAPQQPSPAPPIPTMSPSTSSGPSFNLQGTFSSGSGPSSYSSSPAPAPASPQNVTPASSQRGPTKADLTHSSLANALANRDDGQDTFGNIGALRLASHILFYVLCEVVTDYASAGTAIKLDTLWPSPLAVTTPSSSSKHRMATSHSSPSKQVAVV